MCASLVIMPESSSSGRAAHKAAPSFVPLNGEMVEFTKAGNISRMRAHGGNKPNLPQNHLCNVCPAKFTRITHLHRHLRTRESCRYTYGAVHLQARSAGRYQRADAQVRGTYSPLRVAVKDSQPIQKCGTQFTRSDLLTRHKRNCGDPYVLIYRGSSLHADSSQCECQPLTKKVMPGLRRWKDEV